MQNIAPTVGQADPGKQNTSVPQNEYEEAIIHLAQELNACAPRRTGFYIPARLKQFMEFFQECYQYFNEAPQTQVSASQTSEWLLDNFYVIEQAVRQIEEDLPADYYQRLPKTQTGRARIYLLARMNVQREDTRLDIEQIKHVLQLFQEHTPLSTGELWALPLMLRLAVLESLAEALAVITDRKWETDSRPMVSKESKPSEFTSSQSNPDLVVANSIMNLRLLATQDWKAFFESTSILEKTLRADPAGLYAQMDFETRNRYRSIVEELANGSGMEEASLAMQANQLAQEASSARKKHVGYYLIAQGRERLEALIHFRPSFSRALIRFIQKHATAAYVGSILALTLFFSFLVITYAFQAGNTTLELVAAGLLALLPASSVAIEIINDLVISLIPPRTLPKLNFARGVPNEHRTMVVIPALLATERDAPFLLSQIERHFIGNSDPNIFFALLTDYADAPEKEVPGDQHPVEQTRAAIEKLNKKYGYPGYQPFFFFHRERVWSASEECWMGWERKRGKLEEFNANAANWKSLTICSKVVIQQPSM